MERGREGKIYRPEPTEESLAWIDAATTPKARKFRSEAVVHNIMAESQIGRYPFVVEETEDGVRLKVEPPLTEVEYEVLNKVYFQGKLRELMNG